MILLHPNIESRPNWYFSIETLVFDDGKFDEWCVYVKDKKGKKPPLDIDYFEFFIKLGKKYSNEKVYMDFVKIYDLLKSGVDFGVDF